MVEQAEQMRYPAAVEGYFDDLSAARAAAEALKAVELGPLPPDFEEISVIERTVRAADVAPAPIGFVDRLVAAVRPAMSMPEEIVRDDVAVIVRGTPEQMEEAAEILRRHGAREVKQYAPW